MVVYIVIVIITTNYQGSIFSRKTFGVAFLYIYVYSIYIFSRVLCYHQWLVCSRLKVIKSTNSFLLLLLLLFLSYTNLL